MKHFFVRTKKKVRTKKVPGGLLAWNSKETQGCIMFCADFQSFLAPRSRREDAFRTGFSLVVGFVVGFIVGFIAFVVNGNIFQM